MVRVTRFLVPTVVITALYLILALFLMNWGLVMNTIVKPFPLTYKFNLLLALLEGMFTSMTSFSLTILFLTALFTGVNLTLVAQRLMLLKVSRLNVTVGGGSFLGFIGSGCAACGLPILSLLGLSGSVIYLPFRGSELSLIALLLLVLSFFLLMKGTKQANACRVK